MYAPSPSAFAAPDDAPVTAADALARRQLQQLQALGEMGMEIARRVHRQVIEAGDAEADEARAAPALAELGLAFTRIARTVRLTLALEARVQDRVDARKAGAAAGAAKPWRSPQGLTAVEELKRRLHAAAGPCWTDEDGEPLSDAQMAAELGWRELRDRLADAEEEDGDEDDRRPVGEIIGEICRNLGVEPDWSLWAEEDVAGDGRLVAPPLGELSAKPTEGDFDQGPAEASPLHHAARGPPPRTGAEWRAEPP